MAITYTDNGGGAPDGSDLEFTFTFPVLQTEDVRVALNAIVQATTKYTVNLSTNPTKITFNNTSIDSNVQESTGAPKTGVIVRVFRQTTVGKNNGDEDPKAVFAAGSSIRAADLNANTEQALYAIHELQDQPITDQDIEDGAVTSSKIADGTIVNADINASADIANSKIADGLLKSGITVNSSNIVDGSIVNTDINNSAAIAGTKISPDFGSQNIVTTGTVDGRDVSADGTKLDTIETNAKDDQTAAEIKTLLQSDKLTDSEIATGTLDNRYYTETELDAGQLDNRYFTETELTNGALDGRYFTETESDARYFNISSGETIKDGDSFPDNDTTIATTAAINDRIIDLVDDVGGFVPIANETSFPTSNPDVNDGTGTIVSVAAASTNLAPSGTTVTIANGRGSGLPVVITGVSATIPSGFGFLVETTTTAHTYTFHRLVPKATEVTTVAANATAIATAATNVADINNFADIYQISNSAPTARADSSSLANGDLWFDSSSNKVLMIYDGSSGDGFSAATPNQSDLININIVAGQLVYTEDLGLITEAVNTGSGNNSVNTVAGSIANVNTAATNIANINTVAGNNSNITAVAGNSSNINSAVSNASNINSAVSNASNITTVAGNNSNITTVAGSIANVNTVGASIADVNRYAAEYVIQSGTPSSPSAGDLWYNTGTNILNYYSGSSFVGIAPGIQSLAEDSSPELAAALDCNDNNLTEVGTVSGNNLQIDFGTL